MNKTTAKPTTLSECILGMKHRDPSWVALKYKQKHEWKTLSWPDYFTLIQRLGSGLLELGAKAGDKVGIFSNTRMEWSASDYGVIGTGCVTVPIYQTTTAEDLEYILNNSEIKILFIENKNLLKLFKQVKERCPSVSKVILFEKVDDNSNEVVSWTELLKLGEKRSSEKSNEFTDLLAKAKPDDTATILYTSGTTGLPKGVVLTHRQAISEVSECFPYVGANEKDTSLSFLPYAHILGRVEHWGSTYVASTLAFAESIERIKYNLVDIKPTYMMAVPRIFEKIYSGIWAQVESNYASNKIFRWALATGLRAAEYRMKRESVPIALFAQYQLAQKLALHKVKEAFGGRLRFAISGGAPMPRDVANFFHACEILILEGYGLTETTAAIAVNAPFDYRFGTVGKPVGDVKLKIAEDGEILVKSDKVMKEYYKNPEATKEVFTDGWFHTGDIGEILPSGDLRITDRKKDLIKTGGGKYVAPQKLENLLKAHSFISNILIHGDQKKFIVALFTLDNASITNFAKEKNITYKDFAELTQNQQVLELVRKAVAETNKNLASYETIKRFAIIPHEFTIEGGELTPSLKVKRKVCDKKYKKEIEALYS